MIGIDVIVSFILYVRLFTSPLTQIAQGMTNLQTASASAHRIFDFLESEELPDESGKQETLTNRPSCARHARSWIGRGPILTRCAARSSAYSAQSKVWRAGIFIPATTIR